MDNTPLPLFRDFLALAMSQRACPSSLAWWLQHAPSNVAEFLISLGKRPRADRRFLRSLPLEDLSPDMLRFMEIVDPTFLACRIFTNLDDLRLSGHDLNGLAVRDVSARGMLLLNVDLSGARFTRCDLRDTVLVDCNLDNACFDQCRLEGVYSLGCDWSKARVW